MKLTAGSVTSLESFLNTPTYKALAENTMSFNRKLNEERRMRIPYIDGQTGVAQKHYDNERRERERMPGRSGGQVYTYPQRAWRKRRYQYLQYFMLPRHLRCEPDAEVWRGVGADPETAGTNNEDSGGSNSGQEKVREWETIYEDDYSVPEDPDPDSDDSDFEFDGVRTKKVKSKKASKEKKMTKPPRDPNARRRTHADNIPDSEKPFACDLCLARYKTRPGLTYHYNHSHKEQRAAEPTESEEGGEGSGEWFPPAHHTPFPTHPTHPTHPSQLYPGQTGGPARPGPHIPRKPHSPNGQPNNKAAAEPAGYCDFCLGDSTFNKKSGQAEELIGCSECGRSGHPTCLQFTRNMRLSVRKYHWQCIECKTCTLCGTSENDDQLLFCDDCDRGYHMYCLVPPMKIAPEGSWSCQICVETFHKK